MEMTTFFCLIENPSGEHSVQVERNLTLERPVLVDDVEPVWRPVYLALEYMAFPEHFFRLDGLRLLAGWSVNFDAEELKLLADCLLGAGVRISVMLLVMEEGDGLLVHSLDQEEWFGGEGLEQVEGISFFDPQDVKDWMLRLTPA